MRDVAERTGRRAPHLLIGPWTHSSYLGNTGQLDFGPAASGAVLDGRGGLNAEHLRWYDATLKGDEQALADTAPVRLFVMGENRWRSFDHYPVPGHASRTGTCSPAAGSTAPPRPTVRPTPTSTTRPTPCPPLGGSTMLGPTLPPGPFDQREIEARPDVLSYTSAPLERPCTVLGAVSVTLYRGVVGTGHRLRRPARRRAPRRPRRSTSSTASSAPAPARPTPSPASSSPQATVAPGARRALPVLHRPLGHRIAFLPGHRIRVDITSSSHPRWIRHTNTVGDQSTPRIWSPPGNRSSTTHDARAGSTCPSCESPNP